MNSEYNKIKESYTALGWSILFKVLGFRLGQKYWRQMNLHVTHGQTKIIHREAVLAAWACSQPLPEAQQDLDQQYLQSSQQILDAFLEKVEAECDRDVRKEILAWAENDFSVRLWSGGTEVLWLFTLLKIKSNYKELVDEIDVKAGKLGEIAKIIDVGLWLPRSILLNEFERICESLDGSQEEAELCKANFNEISLVICWVEVRRCWEKIQLVLSPEEQDEIFRWYLDNYKEELAVRPEGKRKILPLRVSEIRDI